MSVVRKMSAIKKKVVAVKNISNFKKKSTVNKISADGPNPTPKPSSNIKKIPYSDPLPVIGSNTHI